jgi:hypothetical protein
VHWKSRPGVHSSRYAQVWLASIYNDECGVGFCASSFAPFTPPRASGAMHVSPRGAIGLYGRYCGFMGTGSGHSTRAKVSLHPHVTTRHPTHSMCAHKQSLPRNVVVWRITSRPGTVYASLGARLRRLPGHERYEVPLDITFSIGTNEGTVDALSQDALDKRRRRGEESLWKGNVRGRAAVCAAAARVFFCARGCVRFTALPRAVLLLCAMSFSVRGAAACDASARCLGRCCCRAQFFCCARGCLFCSALPHAVPLLCARVLFAVEWREWGAAKRASSTRGSCGFPV